MPIKPSPSLTDLIGRRFDPGGLQFAHIIGVAFYYAGDDLEWLRPLLNVNEDINFAILPESERGSAANDIVAPCALREAA